VVVPKDSAHWTLSFLPSPWAASILLHEEEEFFIPLGQAVHGFDYIMNESSYTYM
jgi:hypothetical protein